MSEPAGTTVGFIGLGTMGAPMSTHIAAAGYDLRLFDAEPRVARELAVRIGGSAVAAPGDLAECEIVVLMLPTSAIVRDVLLDADGVPAVPFAPGTVVVDMSSSDPTDTLGTGRALAAHGISMVDAPVSGARPRAEAGTLAIMLGADDGAAAERAVPVIETMSSTIHRTGGLGTGHAMKALNNFVAGAAFAATSEALLAGRRFGLDPAVMVRVLNDSTGQSFSSSHVFGPHVVEGRFASGFALHLLTKDIRIARALQHSTGSTAPVCDAVSEAFEEALGELGAVDHTRAFTAWEQR